MTWVFETLLIFIRLEIYHDLYWQQILWYVSIIDLVKSEDLEKHCCIRWGIGSYEEFSIIFLRITYCKLIWIILISQNFYWLGLFHTPLPPPYLGNISWAVDKLLSSETNWSARINHKAVYSSGSSQEAENTLGYFYGKKCNMNNCWLDIKNLYLKRGKKQSASWMQQESNGYPRTRGTK